MLNTIKISVIFLSCGVLILMPTASYAQDGYGRDDGRWHHEHGYHRHANPDLTLVTGMDTIDSRVLIASGPDQTPEEDIDQSVPEETVTTPVQVISSDSDSEFIVNVPNNAGGFTPVRIQKWGNGYLGPQGELYYPFPEISQLKAMYGV